MTKSSVGPGPARPVRRLRMLAATALTALTLAGVAVGAVPAGAQVAASAVVAPNAVLPNAVATSNAEPVRVMPLGDSITNGYNVPGGYRIRLEDSLAASGHQVDFVGSLSNGPASLADREHEGHSGWRIDPVTANVDRWVARHRPDVVLLTIGTNDMLINSDVADAPRRLGALIDTIAATAPSTTVFVSTLPPLASAAQDERVRAYNAAIPGIVSDKAAQGKRVRLVDVNPALTAGDLADGIHPSAVGYDKMAAVWHAALSSAFAPGPRAILPAGTGLAAAQQLTSPGGTYRAIMQRDGNFVVYAGSRVLWHSRTAGNPGARLAMQRDGNLVIYSAANRALWSSRTRGSARLVMQDDGNLVVYRSDNVPLWNSEGH